MTELLTQKAKMRKSGGDQYSLWNFGIPAYKDSTGFRTCPNAAACVIGCYAKAGAYIWTPTVKAYEWRLAQTKLNTFHTDMVAAINKKLKTATRKGQQLVIRVHDSGDFYSLNYARTWLHISHEFPTVRFYAYTKMVLMFRQLRFSEDIIGDNFTIIYSEGGKEDNFIRPTDRHSRVFLTDSALIEAGYDNASKDDTVAFLSDSGKIGLVYHGVSSKQWKTGGKTS